MKYSFIIPVYNRPDEVDELLDSLTRQTLRDFEVVVVEDGSAIPCKDKMLHRRCDIKKQRKICNCFQGKRRNNRRLRHTPVRKQSINKHMDSKKLSAHWIGN